MGLEEFGTDKPKSLNAKAPDDACECSDCSPGQPINPGEGKSASLTQWTSDGPGTYTGVSKTFARLAPGVYSQLPNHRGELSFKSEDTKVDTLIDLPDSLYKRVLDEIEDFWLRGDKFSEYGFLHRRGYLLYGPQGSGKSAIVHQVMARIVKSGDIVMMCDNPNVLASGLSIFRQIEPNRRVVCIFEDIDAIVMKSGEDRLLSLLDGEHQIDKVLNIACPSPEVRILKSDLTWAQAGCLKVGDEIIAFDESGAGGWQVGKSSGRRYRTSRVMSCPVLTKNRFRVVTENASIVVSENHPFLVKIGNRPQEWRFVQELNRGNKIASIGKPWDTDCSWGGGYLAGQYDGEGSLNFSKNGSPRHGFRVVWGQSVGALVGVVDSILKEKGFSVTHARREMTGGGCVPKGKYKPQIVIGINGGRWGNLRFLGSIRPHRLLSHPRLRDAWEGSVVSVPIYEKVLSVEPCGLGPVIGLETSTRTFIGEGLLQHNTTNYPERLDKRLVARPRRFDRVIRIGMPSNGVRRVYLQNKLGINGDDLDLWVDKSDGLSFAALAELVIGVKCLGNGFEETLGILRKMSTSKVSSDEFSDSIGIKA